MTLIDDLIKDGWLKTPLIIDAFKKIKRADFIDEKSEVLGSSYNEELAELDTALPIGYGQTISQPLVVAFMIEQLQPEKGDKVLDVGSGSGWTTAPSSGSRWTPQTTRTTSCTHPTPRF